MWLWHGKRHQLHGVLQTCISGKTTEEFVISIQGRDVYERSDVGNSSFEVDSSRGCGRQVVYRVQWRVSGSIKSRAKNRCMDWSRLRWSFGIVLWEIATLGRYNHSLCICLLSVSVFATAVGWVRVLCLSLRLSVYTRYSFSADVSGCICLETPVVYLSENVCLCVCPSAQVFISLKMFVSVSVHILRRVYISAIPDISVWRFLAN